MRTHVDLCTGIGGFSLGFIAARLSAPVLFCDFDEQVRKLLTVRFPGIPIANDVKEVANDPTRFIHKKPFILSSGYPCQPFSASGQRKGEEDPRHIFPQIAEIVAQTRPTYCVFENVYGHISLGLDKVLNQMGSLDYATSTFIVPAASFRPHYRKRLWIICKDLSNAGCKHGKKRNFPSLEKGNTIHTQSSGEGFTSTETLSYTESFKSRKQTKWKGRQDTRGRNINTTRIEKERSSSSEEKSTETFTSFRRIFDGISNWVDEPKHIERTTHKNEHRNERLKQLGNALLPQITYRIGLAIKECEGFND